MTRPIPLRPLLILLLAVPSTAAFAARSSNSAPPLPKKPAALLALAALHNGLAGPNLKPWHVKAAYQLYDAIGNPTQSGTFEAWWAGPSEYKLSFTRAGKSLTVYMSPKGSYISGVRKMSLAEIRLEHWLLDPVPDRSDRKSSRLKRKTLVADHIKFDCVKYTPSRPGKSILDMPKTYCLSMEKPILTLVVNKDGDQIIYQSDIQFQGRYLGDNLRIIDNRVPIISARLLSADILNPSDQSTFSLPPEANGHLQPALTAPDGMPAIVAGHRIGGRNPIYPPKAKKTHQQGTVTLEALIGTDGKIHSLKLISSSSPLLTSSAIDAVKTWRYSLYKLAGIPIQVQTIIHAVYKLGPRGFGPSPRHGFGPGPKPPGPMQPGQYGGGNQRGGGH